MSIDPYKGVRDFYPEDERIQKHIFSAMRRAVESFGYEEYNASVLEPTDLYLAKTSEEIINEQTYTFTDRGDRSVTLRPEMTPTVARMVANRKRELGFPLRWYSIQNFFRYERPQRGRLREFWQLNADLFGVTGIEADAEVIQVAYRTMMEMGASEDDFVIKIGSRNALDAELTKRGVTAENHKKVSGLIDRKAKMTAEEYETALTKSARNTFKYGHYKHCIQSRHCSRI
jgi:histidyl-tRNA synthetase